MDRRLPFGRGAQTGPVASDLQSLRENLQARADGWVISSIGETAGVHLDVTGVLPGANTMRMVLLPERIRSVSCYSVRLSVAVADAGSAIQTALYSYEDMSFKRLPGTYVSISGDSTGLKETILADMPLILPETRLFLGYRANSAVVALEGFQAGTASNPGVCRQRVISGHTGDLQASYELASMSLAMADVPYVAYLSQRAAQVL